MSRCLIAIFACYLSLSVCAAEPPPAHAETYLHQGKLAEGETVPLLAVCELNVEIWKHIRSETDDDFEWLSNPKQTDQLGLPMTNQQIDGWLSMINELEQLISGKSLVPGELLQFFGSKENNKGQGLNVKTLMDNPRPDLFNQKRILENGIDPQYLENMNGKKPINIALLFQAAQLFDGPFGFARAIRMN